MYEDGCSNIYFNQKKFQRFSMAVVCLNIPNFTTEQKPKCCLVRAVEVLIHKRGSIYELKMARIFGIINRNNHI